MEHLTESLGDERIKSLEGKVEDLVEMNEDLLGMVRKLEMKKQRIRFLAKSFHKC